MANAIASGEPGATMIGNSTDDTADGYGPG